jgi:hypothetical protein
VSEPAWVQELDEYGYWRGTCAECGTDHEGYPPGTVGAMTRCVRLSAEATGAVGLVDQVDAFERELAQQMEAFIRRWLES